MGLSAEQINRHNVALKYVKEHFYVETVRELMEHTGYGCTQIHRLIKECGYNAGEVSFRRTFNSEVLEDGNWFYFVGLMLADGHISKSGRNFDINLRDEQIIRDVSVWLGTEYKVYNTPVGLSNSGVKYEIHGSGKRFCDRLAKYGVVYQKTGKEMYLNIPDCYYLDFLRGFIDGDGNIPDKHTIDICANKRLCEKLMSDLDRLFGIKDTYIRQCKNTDDIWMLRIKSSSTGPLDSMYYDGCLCLYRKKVKYDANAKRRGVSKLCN